MLSLSRVSLSLLTRGAPARAPLFLCLGTPAHAWRGQLRGYSIAGRPLARALRHGPLPLTNKTSRESACHGSRGARRPRAAQETRPRAWWRDKVARHRANGKLTVRERVAGLVDDGSFEEVGSIAGFPQFVCGRRAISSRSFTTCERGLRQGARERPADISDGRRLYRPRRRQRWWSARQVPVRRDLRAALAYSRSCAWWMAPAWRLRQASRTLGALTFPKCSSSLRYWMRCARCRACPWVSVGSGMGAARVCARALFHHGQGYLAAVRGGGPPVVARTGQTLTKEESVEAPSTQRTVRSTTRSQRKTKLSRERAKVLSICLVGCTSCRRAVPGRSRVARRGKLAVGRAARGAPRL